MYPDAIKKIVHQMRLKGKSYGYISQEINIPKSSLYFMENGRKSGIKKKCGPKPIINKAIALRIKRHIQSKNECGNKVNCNIIKRNLNLDVSRRTINKWLLNNEYKYRKTAQGIVLTPDHKSRRIEAISKWLQIGINWKNAVFSDEKMFSLDGPDNW